MKRDFFQKNILTIGMVVVFIAILFTIINPFNSKQSSNKESLNKLKKEIGQLKQENENLNKKLETEKSFYTDKIKQSDQALSASYTATDEANAQYQNLIEYLQRGIKNELVDSLGIFSPEYTKKGDKIAGLIVSSVSYRSDVAKDYSVDFTGEIIVKGSLIRHDAGGYSIIVEENLEKLPHTLPECRSVFVRIKNENDLIKMLGEKAQKMTPIDKLEFVGVLKNYSCNYVLGNSAEFVRMISQN